MLKNSKAFGGFSANDIAKDVTQQYLKAGLIDEMEIHIAPVLLGGGARLFENTDGQQTDYECIRVVSSPTVSHYKYRRRQTRGTD